MRVMASGAGGYAEYALADWGRVLPMPDANMGWVQAATLPIALQTMHDAVVTNGGLQPGESILIQGASSGVGLMGMQIAKLMGAKQVLGTSRNPALAGELAEFGCDLAIDTGDAAWPDQVLAATGGRGVEVIVDQVSASVANGNLRATRHPRPHRQCRPARRREGPSSTSTCMRCAASTISASPSAPARSRRCARSSGGRGPTCGARSRPAGCALPIDRTFPLAEAAGGAGAYAGEPALRQDRAGMLTPARFNTPPV